MKHGNVRRHFGAVFGVFVILIGLASPLVSLFIPDAAVAAKSDTIETIFGGRTDNTFFDPFGDGSHLAKVSCQAYVETATLSEQLIIDALGTNRQNIDTAVQLVNSNGLTDIFSNAGPSSPPPTNFNGPEYTKYLLKRLGTRVNVLNFYQAEPSPNSTACGSKHGAGKPHYTMVPVCAAPAPSQSSCGNNDDATVWAMRQLTTGPQNDPYSFFVKTGTTSDGSGIVGDLIYYHIGNDGSPEQTRRQGVTIDGAPVPISQPQVNINGMSARYVDIATIDLTFTLNGTEVHERYVDHRWDGLSFYFLASTSHPDRQNLTYTAQNANIADVNGDGDPLCHPGKTVPYIWVKSADADGGQGDCNDFARNGFNLDFSRPEDDFKRRLGEQVTWSGNVMWLNYNSDGTYARNTDPKYPGTPQPMPIKTIDRTMARTWFYAKEDLTAITTAFLAGDTNEQNYIGIYDYDEDSQHYRHLASDCVQLGRVFSNTRPGGFQAIGGGTVEVKWTLAKQNTRCQESYAKDVSVGMTVSDARFEEITQLRSTVQQDDPGPEDTCNKNAKSLSWLVCPMTNWLQDVIGWIDDLILDNLIKVNACRVFNTSKPDGTGGILDDHCRNAAFFLSPGNVNMDERISSEAFYTAWKAVRNLAYALLVILGLIMVVSQIAGLEIFDAYAIRKMLPRLVLATITIPLLWPILRELAVIANNSADAVQELIRAPFLSLPAVKNFDVGLFFAGAAGLAGGGVAILMAAIGGPGFVLALLLSAFIAIFQALIVVALRDIAFFLLVIVSPVAVALATFQPFAKAFSLWRRFLTGVLLSIPAVAGVLTISKVAAAIASISNEYMGVVFAGIFIVVGYLAFWPTLKSTDKLTGQIDGLADRVTGWAQKRLQNIRSESLKNRSRVLMEGELFKGRRGLRGLIQNVGTRIGAGRALSSETGRGFFSAFGKDADHVLTAYDRVVAARRVKGEFQQSIANDDEANAVLAGLNGDLSDESVEGAVRSTGNKKLFTIDPSGKFQLTDDGKRAVAVAKAMARAGVSSRAASAAVWQNKGRAVAAGNTMFNEYVASKLARSESEKVSIMQELAALARSNGRLDAGGTATIGSGIEGTFSMTDYGTLLEHKDGENATWKEARSAAEKHLASLGVTLDTASNKQLEKAWEIARTKLTDANMMDGAGRISVGTAISAHDNSVIQLAETAARLLQSGDATPQQLMQAAMYLKEMDANKSYPASGTVRDLINTVMAQLGVDRRLGPAAVERRLGEWLEEYFTRAGYQTSASELSKIIVEQARAQGFAYDPETNQPVTRIGAPTTPPPTGAPTTPPPTGAPTTPPPTGAPTTPPRILLVNPDGVMTDVVGRVVAVVEPPARDQEERWKVEIPGMATQSFKDRADALAYASRHGGTAVIKHIMPVGGKTTSVTGGRPPAF